MSKYSLLLLVIFSNLFLCASSMGQGLFGTSLTTPNQATQSPQASKPLTPSEFQNHVRALSQQNKAALNQEISQDIAKQPPVPGQVAATTPPSGAPPIQSAPLVPSTQSTSVTQTPPAQRTVAPSAPPNV